MAGDVARERGRHEGRQLVGNPLDGPDPVHAALLGLRVRGVAGPGSDGDLALVTCQRLVAPAGRRRLVGDHLHQPIDQRQAVGVVGGAIGVGRLAQAAHVANHRDRPHRIVIALEAPRRDRRVMDRPVQCKVGLHVPLQAVDDRAAAADAQVVAQLIADEVGDHVPVPGRRLGLRAIGPELGHDPAEVGARDDLRLVWLSGDRVDVVAVAVVRAERVVTDRAGRDVDRRRVRGVQLAGEADDLDRLLLVCVAAELRWRAGIHRYTVGSTGRDGERADMTPVRTNRLLDAVRHRDAVLADHVLELERLPVVRIDHADRIAGDDERRIDRLVVGRRVTVRLVRAVIRHARQDRIGDPVAECCR